MEALPIVGSVVGGLFQSDSVGDAADAQSAATAASIAEQRRQYDLTRSDQQPFMQAGSSAIQRLAQLYGLTPSAGKTRAQLRGELMPAYTNAATAPTWIPESNAGPESYTPGYWSQGQNGSIDEARLNAAIEQAYAQQEAERQAASRDPSFGSAFAPINAGQVQNEPGYQFGQQQGQLGLDRRIAAMGGRVSGQALKAASRFNSDYATTRYGQAYDRVRGERSETLNRLASLAGVGQTAVGQTSQAGQSTGNAISNLMSSQGSATGAASIAQGNIWAGTGNQLAALYGRQTTPTYSSANNFGNVPYGRDTFIPMQPGGGY